MCAMVLHQAADILLARPELLPSALDALADVEFVRAMLPRGSTSGIPEFPLALIAREHPGVLSAFLSHAPAVAMVREVLSMTVPEPETALLMGRVRCELV